MLTGFTKANDWSLIREICIHMTTLHKNLEKSYFLIRKFKWPLNIAIIIYLSLIPIIIFTGGFEIDSLGINMNHISNPIKTVVILLFFRLLFFINVKDFILLLFSVGITLMAIEVTLRVWSPDIAVRGYVRIHRMSPIYGFELVPGASVQGASLREKIDINSDGMRDETIEKTTLGVKKIAVVGDSFTFGVGVELADTYVKQLEKQLNDSSIRCRTYNFGVTGYDLWQIGEVIKRKVLSLSPDLIILGFFHNDMGRSVHPAPNNPDWRGYNPFINEKTDDFFYFNKVLFNVNKIIESKYRKQRGEDYSESMEARKREFGPENPDSPNHQILYGTATPSLYRQFSEKMKLIANVIHQHNIPVLGVFIPDAAQINNPPAQHVNGIFKTECLKNNIPFIDLTKQFETEKDPRKLYLFPLDAHTSPLGHSWIADALAQYIINHQLL